MNQKDLTQIVLREFWLRNFFTNELHILFCASAEEYGLQMGQFFLRDLIDCCDEENFFL